MKKTEFIEYIAAYADIPKVKAREQYDNVFGALYNAIISGEEIYITNIGTFHYVDSKERKGYDMHRNVPVMIPAHKTLKFKMSPSLRGIIKELRTEN